MPDMEFDLDRLFANNNATARIYVPSIEIRGQVEPEYMITGIPQSELAISFSSEYNTPFAMGASQQNLNQKFQLLSGMVGMQGASLESIQQTTSFWLNSTKPQFQLSLLLLRWKTEQDYILTQYTNLLKLVVPVAGAKNLLTRAPAGYNPTGGGSSIEGGVAEGCIHVEIGNWFSTGYCMLVRSVAGTVSKEIVSDGDPLSIRIDIAFEPFLLPTIGGPIDPTEWFGPFM